MSDKNELISNRASLPQKKNSLVYVGINQKIKVGKKNSAFHPPLP